MASVELIIMVVLAVLIILLVGYWIFSDRKFSWTLLLFVLLPFPMFVYLRSKQWIPFVVSTLFFVIALWLYIYDKISTHKATKGGRR